MKYFLSFLFTSILAFLFLNSVIPAWAEVKEPPKKNENPSIVSPVNVEENNYIPLGHQPVDSGPDPVAPPEPAEPSGESVTMQGIEPIYTIENIRDSKEDREKKQKEDEEDADAEDE